IYAAQNNGNVIQYDGSTVADTTLAPGATALAAHGGAGFVAVWPTAGPNVELGSYAGPGGGFVYDNGPVALGAGPPTSATSLTIDSFGRIFAASPATSQILLGSFGPNSFTSTALANNAAVAMGLGTSNLLYVTLGGGANQVGVYPAAACCGAASYMFTTGSNPAGIAIGP
ncbi:MAG: hypothetical protein M3N19_09060, partial [Candidatus Eremiobacteraeota bacterium]|nr:hypothetical protein [Candidatus Eremiobacteraeota bacterium]